MNHTTRSLFPLMLLALFVGCEADGEALSPEAGAPVRDAGLPAVDDAAADAPPPPDPDPDPVEDPIEDPPSVDEELEGWSPETHEKGAPAYDIIFDDTKVHRIDLTMAAASYQAMLDDMEDMLGPMGSGGGGGRPGGGRPGGGGGGGDFFERDPIYVPINLVYEGRLWQQVAMRFKGNSSLSFAWQRGEPKFGFRLHFDKYEDAHPEIDDQRFFGFKKMTFAAGHDDASLMRDKLASELLRAQGVPAARVAFYKVYVDVGDGPEYWGLYSMIEDPSDQLIEDWFEDDDGNMYKPEGDGADWTHFDAAGFEKKTNEDAGDWGDVEAAIEALHAEGLDAEAWRAGLEDVFDVDSFLNWMAVNQAMENWDAYGAIAHNYYLYGDPADDGRLVWIPWDHNESLRPSRRGDASMDWSATGESWPLIRKVMDDPVYRGRYFEHLEAFLDGPYQTGPLFARMESLHALIADAVAEEQAPFTHLASYAAFEAALEGGTYALKAHVLERRALAEEALLTLR